MAESVKNKYCRKCDKEHPETREFWMFNRGQPERCKAHRLEYQRNKYKSDPQYRTNACSKRMKPEVQNKADRKRAWNPERLESQERGRLGRKYGITPEFRDELFCKQKGRCAICDRKRKLSIDHCHQTGRVRGLLCGNCNRGIGLLDESPKILDSAKEYLKV